MALLKRKRTGLGDAMEVVTRFVNACNRHDADAVFACLHPQFDSIQPMYPVRNFRGADQVRRNWQAIFDAEPGFRLTVLRSAAADDTVWLELHGAGREAEVAGIFIMGIQGDRIRWARIYSGLVEPLPPGTEDATATSAPLREVPPLDESRPGGNGEVVEEALIAPVVDIERSGRRRRRSSRRRDGEAGETAVVAGEEPRGADAGVSPPETEGDAEPPSTDAGWAPVIEDEPAPEGEGESETVAVSEPATMTDVAAEPATMTDVAAEPATMTDVAAEPATMTDVAAEPAPVAASDVVPDAEAEVVAEPAQVVVEDVTEVVAEPEAKEPTVWPEERDQPETEAAAPVGTAGAGEGAGEETTAGPEVEAAADLLTEPEPEVVAEPVPVPEVASEVTADPEPEPAPAAEAARPEPPPPDDRPSHEPKWRFGKRR